VYDAHLLMNFRAIKQHRRLIGQRFRFPLQLIAQLSGGPL